MNQKLDSNSGLENTENSPQESNSLKVEDQPDQKGQQESNIDAKSCPEIPSLLNENVQKCILFYGVTYLGCASVNAPKNEEEINRIISTLNEQCKLSIQVTMYVPQHIEDKIILMDDTNETIITEYKMTHVLFVVRGQKYSPDSSCFAFTTCQGDSRENLRFSCHVFRCQLSDAVSKILYSFWTVFNRQHQKQHQENNQKTADINKRSSESSSNGQLTSMASSIFSSFNFSAASFGSLTSSITNATTNSSTTNINTSLPYSQEFSDFALKFTDGNFSDQYIFRAILDIKEEDLKTPNNFISVPKDKETFKLRKNFDKQIVIAIQQLTNQTLEIERCFGVLMCPGRNVSHKDMQLLQTTSMGKTVSVDNTSQNINNYLVTANWNIQDTSATSSLQVLNDETQKEMKVFMTVAVDLVINGLQDPVRFCIETKARVYSQNEKFWVYNRQKHFEEFYVQIKNNSIRSAVSSTSPKSPVNPNFMYSLDSIHSKTELIRKKNIEMTMIESVVSEDENETVVSGCGIVTKECGEEELLCWSDLLSRWKKNTWNERPKGLQSLVRKGIPEALRGEVWQLLAGCNENEKSMNESYRLLLSKDSPSENIIIRDINRTFTGHKFFQDEDGQQALYKLSKAYSIYDEEVGYCQGLSFLIASLLLHVPEEQAFNLLVKIMYRYELESLIRENLPQLYEHFVDLNIEAHMYASQWFLTLYTAKFPLNMVFRIMDLFLSEGMLVVFSMALALLKNSQNDLLTMDFEGILKYFRVTMPKKYRQEICFKELMQVWITLNGKITEKKLKKYENKFKAAKEAQALKEDPCIRLERECKKLNLSLRRLEQENDDVANEYIETKLDLTRKLEESRDECNVAKNELIRCKNDYQIRINDSQDTNTKLTNELEELKKIWRSQSEKYESDLERNGVIIQEYKQICNTLSNKIEKWSHFKNLLEKLEKNLSLCESCKKLNFSELHECTILESETEILTNKNETISLRDLIKKKSAELLLSELPYRSTGLDEKAELVESSDPLLREDTDHCKIKILELELARIKLELVNSECKNQELDHELKGYKNKKDERFITEDLTSSSQNTSVSESLFYNNKGKIGGSNGSINSSVGNVGSSWLSKTFTQLREAKNQVLKPQNEKKEFS